MDGIDSIPRVASNDSGETNVRTRVRGARPGGQGSFCLELGQGEAVSEKIARKLVSHFRCFCDLQQLRLAEMRAEDLEADGEVFSLIG